MPLRRKAEKQHYERRHASLVEPPAVRIPVGIRRTEKGNRTAQDGVMILRRVAPPSRYQANHCDGHEAGAKPLPRQTTDYGPQTTCHRPQTTDLGPMGQAGRSE